MIRKILVLSANPIGTRPLRLDQEIREIDEGLRRSQNNANFVLEKRLATRIEDLRRALLDEDPIFVHFCGHGNEHEGLLLEDIAGCPQLVRAEPLANLFKLFSAQVKCVVLNACYSESQATAISQHIDYVVGMRQAIGDQAAIRFSTGFYDAVGAGRSVEDAFEFGRNAIELYNIIEEYLPVLRKKGVPLLSQKRSWGHPQIVGVPKSFSEKTEELDIVEVSVEVQQREKAYLVRDRAINFMTSRGYPTDVISDFDTCFQELITNAFEHGCSSIYQKVYISIEVTNAYVTIQVKNPKNVEFDLDVTLNQQLHLIKSNPYSRRGRGLITVYNLSDSLQSTADNCGLKAAIYPFYKVKFNVKRIEDLLIIQIIAGHGNPSINRRLLEIVNNSTEQSLIIHIPRSAPTGIFSSLLDLQEIFRQLGRKLVVLLHPSWEYTFHTSMLPSEIVAHFWEQALEKVDAIGKEEIIRKMCRKGTLMDCGDI